MVKITIDAGHGGKDKKGNYTTAGKRTPNGIPEWNFNSKQAHYCIEFLKQYDDVEILRVDDSTGFSDVSLEDRVKKSNAFNSNVYVSFHNNALSDKWNEELDGMETFIFTDSQKSKPLQTLIHANLHKETKNNDRGMKQANFYVLKYTKCPSILLESFFMDGREDYKKLSSESYLKSTGEAVARCLVVYFNLKPKKKVVAPVTKAKTIYKVQVGAFSDKANAIKLSNELTKKGYKNIII
jgi:N-acetylmuramoyl-L-alanine amidase